MSPVSTIKPVLVKGLLSIAGLFMTMLSDNFIFILAALINQLRQFYLVCMDTQVGLFGI